MHEKIFLSFMALPTSVLKERISELTPTIHSQQSTILEHLHTRDVNPDPQWTKFRKKARRDFLLWLNMILAFHEKTGEIYISL